MTTARLTHPCRAHRSSLWSTFLLAWLATFVVLFAASSLFAAAPTATAAPAPISLTDTRSIERHVILIRHRPGLNHPSLPSETDTAINTNDGSGDRGSAIDPPKETTQNANLPIEMNLDHHTKRTSEDNLPDTIPVVRSGIGMITITTPSSVPPSPSGSSQPAQVPLPFPASLWDSPGHAIASGLFVGVVGTCLFWLVGFMVRIYVGWVWRGAVGVLGEVRARRDLSHQGGVGGGVMGMGR